MNMKILCHSFFTNQIMLHKSSGSRCRATHFPKKPKELIFQLDWVYQVVRVKRESFLFRLIITKNYKWKFKQIRVNMEITKLSIFCFLLLQSYIEGNLNILYYYVLFDYKSWRKHSTSTYYSWKTFEKKDAKTKQK